MTPDLEAFLHARDFLLAARSYEEAEAGFQWPDLIHFNWALDYFDHMAEGNAGAALVIADESGSECRRSFDEMRIRSNRVANFLKNAGLQKEDVVMLMMNNSAELFEVFLAAMKTAAVITPASTLLTPADIGDRIKRGKVKCVVADASMADRIEEAGPVLKDVRIKIIVGGRRHGWTGFDQADVYGADYTNPFPTYSTDPCLLYFTSGTTAKPKMVLHTHASYPAGHLVTMFWVGLKPGDMHCNISAPGWGKHAWSSFFSPWNAGATVFVNKYERFNAAKTLELIEKHRITTLCAPPTVWRRFLIEDLAAYRFSLREIVSAGEPLNPEIISRVRAATGITIREGYGQTETVLQIGTFPGMPAREGAIGKRAPGFRAQVVDAGLRPQELGAEGQIALRIAPERPLGLMKGYACDRSRGDEVFIGGWYLTGDMASVDKDGYFWFVGRTDDVFKCSDYRISPFEVESGLLAHPAVAEAAVVGSLDKDRGGLVPKAFIALRPGFDPSRDVALDIFRFCLQSMAPYKRPRRIEFMQELLKTISGKLRRAELREYDDDLRRRDARGKLEFIESDFPGELGKRHA